MSIFIQKCLRLSIVFVSTLFRWNLHFHKKLPLRKIILFESNPDLSDNTFFVYRELLRRGFNKKYKFIWLLNSPAVYKDLPKNVQAVYYSPEHTFSKYRRDLLLARARFIIDCNNYVNKTNSKTVRVHLKHGLAIKDIPFYNRQLKGADLITVTSDFWIDSVAKDHDVPKAVVKPLGFPRNDVLKPVPHKQKTIIWMPTFRVHATGSALNEEQKKIFRDQMPFGLPFIQSHTDLQKINTLFAANDALLLIRLHPVQDVSGIHLSALSNIHLCDDAYLQAQNTTLYELLSQTDALVTDYSSVYYDYLLMDKPIALTAADFDDYLKYAGLVVPDYPTFQKAFPAVFAESYAQLLSFFEDVFQGRDTACDARRSAYTKYMGSQTDHSAQTIVDYMTEHFGL